MVWRKKSPAPLHALIPAIPPTDDEHLHSARSYSRRRLQLAEQCKLSVPGHCDSHSLAFLFLFFYGITLRFFCTSLDRIFFPLHSFLFRFLPIWKFPHSGVFFGFVSSPWECGGISLAIYVHESFRLGRTSFFSG